jgi:hypothetical protein
MSCINFKEEITKKEHMAITLTKTGGTVQLSGNPIWINTTTDRTDVTEQKMMLEITSDDGDVSGGPWTLKIAGTSCSFNISSIVDAPASIVFDYSDSAIYFNRDAAVFSFSIVAGECYVDADNEYQEVWDDTTYSIDIIKGKLTQQELSILDLAESSFYDYYIYDGRFLSSIAESGKAIYVNDISDPVKMWISYLRGQALTLYCYIAYNEGGLDQGEITISGATTENIVEINCHLLIASLANSEKTVKQYSVYSTDEAYCMVYVSGNYTEYSEVLYFLNRYGAIEALNCYGNISEGIKTESEEYTKQSSVSSTIFDPTIIAISNGNEQTYKINTGYKTLAERRWIKDLLMSPYRQVWVKSTRLPNITDEDYGFAPIAITSGSYEIDTISEDLMSIDIEYKIAHND